MHYKILSICENKPTFYFANLWVRTVTEASANIGIGEFYIAEDKDHLNVCKPESRQSFIYQKIYKVAMDLISSEYPECENCKIEFKLIEKRNEKYLYRLFANFNNFY